jgi:NAD(P)-dependent dehydrogenase (short-subunit alcohol dehydrogenase family)
VETGLAGRGVLVTGASGGIGGACARAFAAEGARVACHYHRGAERAEALAVAIGGVALPADLAREDEVERLFAQTDAQLGRVTHLVNNAGITGRSGRLDEVPVETVAAVFDLNVMGSFLCARAAIRRMSMRHGGNGGVIVNLSSVAAQLGSPNTYVDYAASKGAIDTFTIGLSQEVAAEGIRVAGIRPGLIDTEIHASGGDPDRHHRLSKTVPMQRVGSADEIANAIVWLMSDEASYVTGTTLNVSGGR